jgi:hypothetical protein
MSRHRTSSKSRTCSLVFSIRHIPKLGKVVLDRLVANANSHCRGADRGRYMVQGFAPIKLGGEYAVWIVPSDNETHYCTAYLRAPPVSLGKLGNLSSTSRWQRTAVMRDTLWLAWTMAGLTFQLTNAVATSAIYMRLHSSPSFESQWQGAIPGGRGALYGDGVGL